MDAISSFIASFLSYFFAASLYVIGSEAMSAKLHDSYNSLRDVTLNGGVSFDDSLPKVGLRCVLDEAAVLPSF